MDIVDFGENLLSEILDEFPRINKYDLIRTFIQVTIGMKR